MVSRWWYRGCALAAAFAATVLVHGTALADDGMSPMDAYKALASHRMVDLTHSFGVDTPVWSGYGQATMSAASEPATHRPYTIEKDGFRATFYSLVGQYGTHVDPPAHFDPDGATMDMIPLKDMFLPLVVLDDTQYMKDDPNHAFTVDDLHAWEKQHGQVPRGSFAALRTDMSKDWTANPARFKRFPFPAWSFEVVRYLFQERGVTAIGHEALDTDTSESMQSETWLLQQGHYQIEVMNNLDQVPATGAVIFVTWPKVENGLGFPARAIAFVP